MDDGRPIFQQIASTLEARIIDGSMPEETQVPSINELAAFHRINPATALKGVTLLVDAGVLYKRRGIGMFVAAGARDRLVSERREAFRDTYVRPLLEQAAALGLDSAQLAEMIRKEADA
ncbi:GntR family transcriptional regulator [Demequina sp. SYSU T00039]|uniref:GntR family transcriptional regulator n=1 Tax=Demequina lignilytica TaxID=3051663 RepID=A0AAW7M7D2_9MICO|nr:MULTISPECIES: GntR family transcriptional regulator [unclassified Demequina]MDN4479287.1 GntR family transcriptional regulator [Demequina sp. SYSU T00039-1]MDN4488746.1 GntR family transcriptional regulator [Demequina sp. SYSU T00039]